MKLTEILRKLMSETAGQEIRLREEEVEIKEFQDLFPWFTNHGIIISLKNPQWIASRGLWAEAYIAFEEGDEAFFGIKGTLPTEEKRNIIITGGKVRMDGMEANLDLSGTDQRLVILSYIFEKSRDKPSEELDLYLRYIKAVPSIGIVGMTRLEPVFAKMPKGEQKRFLKILRTESKSIPILKEAINILDRSEIDVSYA